MLLTLCPRTIFLHKSEDSGIALTASSIRLQSVILSAHVSSGYNIFHGANPQKGRHVMNKTNSKSNYTSSLTSNCKYMYCLVSNTQLTQFSFCTDTHRRCDKNNILLRSGLSAQHWKNAKQCCFYVLYYCSNQSINQTISIFGKTTIRTCQATVLWGTPLCTVCRFFQRPAGPEVDQSWCVGQESLSGRHRSQWHGRTVL